MRAPPPARRRARRAGRGSASGGRPSPGRMTISASPSRTRVTTSCRCRSPRCSRRGAGGRLSWRRMLPRRAGAGCAAGGSRTRHAATPALRCHDRPTSPPDPRPRPASGPHRDDGRRPVLGERPRRPRRPDRRRRAGRHGADIRSGRRRGSSSSAVGRSRRASRTPTSTRSTAGLDDAPLRPPRRRVSGPRYLDRIAAYAARHPDESWIRGGGWYMAAFPGGTPRRDDLDRIVPDRPAFLTSRDGHGAWVNSPGARDRGHHRRTRRPAATGGSSATPTGRRPGPSTRARSTSSTRLLPDDTPGRPRGGAAARPAAPARVRHHRLAGRHHRARGRGARLRDAGDRAAS